MNKTSIEWTHRPGTTGMTWPDELVARFWSYVDMRSADECWPWKGGRFDRGYGQFRLGTKKVKAHRVAYELVNGPLGNLRALHRCDNPPCCNPAHIFRGTLSDNSKDRDAKGRRQLNLKPLTGESNPHARLCAGQVLEIRALAQAGLSNQEIAQRYDIARSTVHGIATRRAWRHLSEHNVN